MKKPDTSEKNALQYDKNAYDRPSVTVDIAVCTFFNSKLQVLLVKRDITPFKDYWALPGGFVNITNRETLEETAARKLKEETSLCNINAEQLKTYGDPDRDPRMRVITVAHFALMSYRAIASLLDNCGIKNIQLFPVAKLPKNVAFDHKKIINDLLIRIQGRITYSPVAFSLLDSKFTWCELQEVYESVLEKEIITPNFRRKINSMYEIIELDETLKTKGRPSRLLMFNGVKEF